MNDKQHKDLLRLVWKHRLFASSAVELADGTLCAVSELGNELEDRSIDGVDFHGVHLVGSQVDLHGGVRIDARSSIWRESGQMSETGQDNVVLHIVGERDRMVMRNGREVQTLVLDVRSELKGLYERMLRDAESEPDERECIRFFSEEIERVEREQILAGLMIGRLKRKVEEVLEIYQSLGEDWEETAYVCFLRSLGMGDKKRSYEALARSLPYRCILRCSGDVQQIEALLMGQSGYLSMLGSEPDAYTKQLQDIYLALKKTYSLKRPVVVWGGKDSGPVRPYSLPPAMLAQAAHLLGREPKLFSRLLACAGNGDGMKELREVFRPGNSDYWNGQYLLEEKRYHKSVLLSDQKIDLRVINFVIPLMSAKGVVAADAQLRDWALGLYEEVAPEANTYTRQWSVRGFEPANAFDSQAVIQLATEYCRVGTCGVCPIGALRMVRLWKGLN